MTSRPELSTTDDARPNGTQRVILLGASNITLAWPRIMALIQSGFSRSVEVYTAHGMGRSYCAERSGFAFRQLPGILRSDLWNVLPQGNNNDPPPTALITDLGNDLVYGSSPEEVAAATVETVERIRSWNSECRIAMTRPPVHSVNTLGSIRFMVCKAALFPFSGLRLPAVKTATLELDRKIVELADRLSIPLTATNSDWYGLDPIHVKRSRQTEAFSKYFDPWSLPENNDSNPPHRRPLNGLTFRPTARLRWVWGTEKQTQQPVLTDGGFSVFAF
ncbi:MAG: hypothetical protein WBH50_18220 [Fuerstiella sp.]